MCADTAVTGLVAEAFATVFLFKIVTHYAVV